MYKNYMHIDIKKTTKNDKNRKITKTLTKIKIKIENQKFQILIETIILIIPP